MIKILNEIDISDILEEYNRLESSIVWTESFKGKQAGLQYKSDTEQTPNYQWTNAVGRNTGLELSYDQLNPFFKDTIFEKIINDYKITRTRLMWVNRMSCYSIHSDSTPRLHIPLITNPECYFMFKNNNNGMLIHMQAGHVYWADTRREHTFINCSEMNRLHLVGVTES